MPTYACAQKAKQKGKKTKYKKNVCLLRKILTQPLICIRIIYQLYIRFWHKIFKSRYTIRFEWKVNQKKVRKMNESREQIVIKTKKEQNTAANQMLKGEGKTEKEKSNVLL